MKIYIEDWNDELKIIIKEDEKSSIFEIYKDDGFRKLEEIFTRMGIDCEYEECY